MSRSQASRRMRSNPCVRQIDSAFAVLPPATNTMSWPSVSSRRPSGGGRELLGGKGIGLAEMTQMGVPVPAGFTITTDACRAYMSNGKTVPDGLDDEVDNHLRALEEKTGKRFGDPDDPLLVSV